MIRFNPLAILLLIAATWIFACNSSESASAENAVQPDPVKPGIIPPASQEDTPAKSEQPVVAAPDLTTMKRVSVLNNRISVLLPVSFRPMTQKEYAVKYGVAAMEKDMLVFTDKELEANLLIHLTDEPIDSTGIQTLTHSLLSELKAMPQYKFIRSGTVKAGNLTLQTMEFEIETLDAKSVSVIYFGIADNKLLKGNFNFPSSLRSKWHNVAMQSIQSVSVVNGE